MKKQKLNEKWKDMKGIKRFGIIGLAVILLLGISVSAYYLFSYDSGDIEYSIVGVEGSLNVVVELQPVIWDLNDSLTHTQNLTLQNNNGDTSFNVSFDLIKNITDISCSGDEDFYYNLSMNNNEVFDNDIIEIVSGVNVLVLEVGTEFIRACPREDIVQIGLVEV